jgi:hypothetical protein
MKTKGIVALIALVFFLGCNQASNQSTKSQDSTVTPATNNITVSPGTNDPLKNGMQDSAMSHLDSGSLNKR